MIKAKIKLWYKSKEPPKEIIRMLSYIPDSVIYESILFKKIESVIDLDNGKFSIIHYKED